MDVNCLVYTDYPIKGSSFYWQTVLARNCFWHFKLGLLIERERKLLSYRNPESHGASCCQLLLLEMAVLNPLQEYVCPLRKVRLWYPSKLPFFLCPFLFLEKMKGGKSVYQQILKKKNLPRSPKNPMWNLQVQKPPENKTCWDLRPFAAVLQCFAPGQTSLPGTRKRKKL